MFTLTEPTDRDVDSFLSQQSNLPFSYAEVGATRTEPGNGSSGPRGYNVDHNRIQLGSGVEVYARAVEALRQWRQFELGWVSLVPRGVKIEEGATVAVKARACGTWSLNACRVVYVLDEANGTHDEAQWKRDRAEPSADKTRSTSRQATKRFGFAYGTLPDHIERGEERFLVAWNRTDDSVWYDILAFSQPRHPLVRLGFPIARMMQKRFARDSLAAMKSAVESA